MGQEEEVGSLFPLRLATLSEIVPLARRERRATEARAKYWQTELKMAMLNAMNNADDVIALAQGDRFTNVLDDAAALAKSKKVDGNAKWEAVAKEAKQDLFRMQLKIDAFKAQKAQACFIAGTLVHTEEGLVPIEQIKVGDLVLSRPENDKNGQLEYKRVTRTFVHENEEFHLLCCASGPGHYPGYVNDRAPGMLEWIGVTANHPIYAYKDKTPVAPAQEGWRPAMMVDGFGLFSVELLDGKRALVRSCNLAYDASLWNTRRALIPLYGEKDWFRAESDSVLYLRYRDCPITA